MPVAPCGKQPAGKPFLLRLSLLLCYLKNAYVHIKNGFRLQNYIKFPTIHHFSPQIFQKAAFFLIYILDRELLRQRVLQTKRAFRGTYIEVFRHRDIETFIDKANTVASIFLSRHTRISISPRKNNISTKNLYVSMSKKLYVKQTLSGRLIVNYQLSIKKSALYAEKK